VIADQLASLFTVLVLVLAAGAALYWYAEGSSRTLSIVLSILVVSCPCALSLATPSALACCYQALRKQGLLIHSSNLIEQCRHITHVVFDKTGTLTDGKFSMAAMQVWGEMDEKTILELSSALEKYSEHPLASAFHAVATDLALSHVQTFSGKGVEGEWQGERYRIGSQAYCAELAGAILCDDKTASVYLAKSGQWLASFQLQDKTRADAALLVHALQGMGKQVELLSGDSSGAAELLARELNIDVCHSAMSPEQKLEYITALQAQGHRVMMVGDGFNDIPVLAQAHVSVAMNHASDLAKIKADAIFLGEQLLPLLSLFKHSAKARGIIVQNIVWALLYNSVTLPMAAMGLVPPWLAALGMSVSSLAVTFNSLRLGKI